MQPRKIAPGSNAPHEGAADLRKSKPSAADIEAAARLRAAWQRRPKGVTQQTVADLLEASQSAVSQYLHGRIPLNYRAAQAFAIAIGCRPEDIRTDLPEQQLMLGGRVEDGRASYITVEPDERTLLQRYRNASPAKRKTFQSILDAFFSEE